MTGEKRWRALHAIDDEYFEPLHVAERLDGSVIYEVGGERGTSRDADAAMKTADLRFRKLFPTHVCSRVCSTWVLVRGGFRPEQIGAFIVGLLAGCPAFV